jgi:GTP-binding protein
MMDAPQSEAETARWLEAGRVMFARQWEFLLGVARVDQLPPASGIEVAFAGRSNVGKSSLLNALTQQKALARISNTPGRTRELNLFAVQPGLTVVDMPGYGYHKAGKAAAKSWTQMVFSYLRGRANLRRVYLLVDSRRGLMATDREVMDLLDRAAVSYQLVLTKTDQLKPDEMGIALAAATGAVRRHPAAHPEVLVSSSETGAGLPILRAEIAGLVA